MTPPPKTTSSTRTPAAETEPWAGSKDDWQRRAGPHQITLPSGMRVRVRLLGLGTLARMEGLPEELTTAVILHLANADKGGLGAVIADELARSESDPEAAAQAAQHMRELGELTKHLVAEALVEPRLTVAELGDPDLVPEGDLEKLMRIATGRDGFDSEGVRIGVEPLDAWATFRGEHGCDEDCAHCASALDRLSSLHLGAL